MSPPEEALIIAANAALADPNFRASLRQMHAEGYPLVRIVEALGLDDDMNDRIRGSSSRCRTTSSPGSVPP